MGSEARALGSGAAYRHTHLLSRTVAGRFGNGNAGGWYLESLLVPAIVTRLASGVGLVPAIVTRRNLMVRRNRVRVLSTRAGRHVKQTRCGGYNPAQLRNDTA